MAKFERKPQEPKPERKALFETVAEDLIKRMEAGTAPWQKPWNESANVLLPYNPTTGKNYKGLNTFALMMTGHDDPRWMTFKQADANQWQVKKGEKGTLINFYKFDEQKAVRDEKGKPVLDDKGKQKYITVKREKPIITAAWVFNAEQINGIPPLVKTIQPENKWQAIDAVENIVQNSGALVKNVPGDRAFYSPGQDFIQMPAKDQFPDPSLYYATLLHEVGHWTGHKDRLNRDILNQFGTADYAKEELRAEIGSYMLGTDLKIGHDPERHASYVANWIEVLKNDPYEIHRAASDAQKIFDYVKKFEQKVTLKEEVAAEIIPEGLNQGQGDREELSANGIPERLKIGNDEVTLTPQQWNDLEFGRANIGKLDKYEDDVYLFRDPVDKKIIHVRNANPVEFAEPIGLNQPEKAIINGVDIQELKKGMLAGAGYEGSYMDSLTMYGEPHTPEGLTNRLDRYTAGDQSWWARNGSDRFETLDTMIVMLNQTPEGAKAYQGIASQAWKIADPLRQNDQSKETLLAPGQDPKIAKATNAKSKANFGLNEVINYKDGFEVMALLKQGSLRMQNKSTEQVFILRPTDRLYENLLKAKSQPLSESLTIKEPKESVASTINSAFEIKGAELESIQQRQSGFKR